MDHQKMFIVSFIVYSLLRYCLPRILLDEEIVPKKLIVHSSCYAITFIVFKYIAANKYL